MSIEIVQHGNREDIEAWERAHDKRESYICNRCHCIWKCEWKDNKFGSSHDYNGDPDILCPECGSNDTSKVAKMDSAVFKVIEFLSGRESK